MQRIPRELARKYAFDWEDEPLLRVRPGEALEIETFDAEGKSGKSAWAGTTEAAVRLAAAQIVREVTRINSQTAQ